MPEALLKCTSPTAHIWNSVNEVILMIMIGITQLAALLRFQYFDFSLTKRVLDKMF